MRTATPLVPCCACLVARKAALDERLSRLAREGDWWRTVARLRCFRGIDTLSAFVLSLEIGDWTRFSRPAKLAGWRAGALARPVGREPPPAISSVVVPAGDGIIVLRK